LHVAPGSHVIVHAPPEHDMLQMLPEGHSNVHPPPEHEALHVVFGGHEKSHAPSTQLPLHRPAPHAYAPASTPPASFEVPPTDQS